MTPGAGWIGVWWLLSNGHTWLYSVERGLERALDVARDLNAIGRELGQPGRAWIAIMRMGSDRKGHHP